MLVYCKCIEYLAMFAFKDLFEDKYFVLFSLALSIVGEKFMNFILMNRLHNCTLFCWMIKSWWSRHARLLLKCSLLVTFVFKVLMDLANSYCETHLKKQCERIIKQGIHVDNAALLLAASIRYEAKVNYVSQIWNILCILYTLNNTYNW